MKLPCGVGLPAYPVVQITTQATFGRPAGQEARSTKHRRPPSLPHKDGDSL